MGDLKTCPAPVPTKPYELVELRQNGMPTYIETQLSMWLSKLPESDQKFVCAQNTESERIRAAKYAFITNDTLKGMMKEASKNPQEMEHLKDIAGRNPLERMAALEPNAGNPTRGNPAYAMVPKKPVP